jgi:putative oxidoreductase
MTSTLAANAPRMLSVLRIVTALIFLLHGSQKLLGIPPSENMPAFLSFMWIGGFLELAGGLLLLVGLFTRAAAFVVSGEMAVAYWMFHAPRNLFPTLNGGDAAILYCFVFLYFVFAGPGPWSIDALWRRAEGVPPRG